MLMGFGNPSVHEQFYMDVKVYDVSCDVHHRGKEKRPHLLSSLD